MVEYNTKILIVLENNPFTQSSAPANRLISLINGLLEYNIKIDLLILNGYINNYNDLEFYQDGSLMGIKYYYFLPTILRRSIINKIVRRLIPFHYYSKYIENIFTKNSYTYIWLGVSPNIVKVGIELFEKKLKTKYIHERSEFSYISLNEKIHSEYLKKFLPNIDFLVIMTKTLIDYYQKFVTKGTSIIHLPMTVDFKRFETAKGKNSLKKPYVGYCGTMNNAKDGVEVLMQAFIEIMNDYPKYNLYIVGPPEPKEDYDKLQTMVKNNNASERITFLGFMNKNDIPVFLNNASILAMARPDSKQAQGGFPTKLGEYLATGNPVCITAVGEIENYLKHNESAFIAKPNDIKSFTKVLKEAMSSSKAIEIGLNGRKVALKNFNKDIQAKLFANHLIK